MYYFLVFMSGMFFGAGFMAWIIHSGLKQLVAKGQITLTKGV